MAKLFTNILIPASLFFLLALNQQKEAPKYHTETVSQQSRLVKLTAEGRLTYGLYANEGEEEKINRLPDFSYAGYMGGGVRLPDIAVKITLSPLRGDNRSHLQDAIDKVSSMPADRNGFRGKILLKAGTYPIEGNIKIFASGVVLAGEGQDERGTILKATRQAKHTFITIGKRSKEAFVIKSAATRITSDYVPTGSDSFTVASAVGYQPGDTIIIQKTPDVAWVRGLGMEQYGWTPASYMISHERVITAIKGNQVSINIPVVDPVKVRDGGGQVYKVKSNRRTKQSGIENLRVVSSYKHEEDEEHGWCGIILQMAENCWVKKVSVQHFGFSAVTIDKGSAFNTVEDCAMLDPKARTIGMRKYSFNIQSGSFNLIQRCYTRGGRHDYVTGPKVTGPNVFLDCYATEAKSDIGPHHRWATGTLFDNIQGRDIRVINRKSSGTGHGWAGAQTMFWNCISTSGKGMTIENPPGSINWQVGGMARNLSGDGYQELLGQQVTPRSLYLAQLQNRLGQEALYSITTTSQRNGVLYDDLEKWAGQK
ncbi:hypothetical protein [Pontibacter beigongshangensis]|uniref:hypothetical protein n=1 Tax=Pontibacter beigongshangensis TaxID=2574733 RepID=UPI00164F398D|nr:hypothetical protein [Pontibacter beigongshangensis]